jgi:hypothetical protein
MTDAAGSICVLLHSCALSQLSTSHHVEREGVMKAPDCSDLMSLICCQMLSPIHHTTHLRKKSLMLSVLQRGAPMGCLLHLLCESA